MRSHTHKGKGTDMFLNGQYNRLQHHNLSLQKSFIGCRSSPSPSTDLSCLVLCGVFRISNVICQISVNANAGEVEFVRNNPRKGTKVFRNFPLKVTVN